MFDESSELVYHTGLCLLRSVSGTGSLYRSSCKGSPLWFRIMKI